MKYVGTRGQAAVDSLFDASGTITSGGTAQLLLPAGKTRSYLLIINTSSGPLYVDFGSARATATLTTGAVTSFTVTNGGQGFTNAPIVTCLGGGPVEGNKLAGLSATEPTWPSPARPCLATAVLSGGAVASISINDPGAGYLQPPYVYLQNSPYDANGVVTASATSIPLLTTGAQVNFEGTVCPTGPVCIFGATTAQSFVCKFMD